MADNSQREENQPRHIHAAPLHTLYSIIPQTQEVKYLVVA